ncbi:hypothetical protein BGZ63DRAFT_454557 [Mariannaea sp. PMI_226]|nr:hypothetical protein BGZ63DRAFT_454557 [Mariannaea sp. PMI_226]
MTDYPQTLGLSDIADLPDDLARAASPDSTYSRASSYGSVDSGVSHPPRTRSKRKKKVIITWGEFTSQCYDQQPLSTVSGTLEDPTNWQSQSQQQQQQQQQHYPHEHGTNTDNFPRVYLPPKQRLARELKACRTCRQRKVKCDRTKPCKRCRDEGLECKYNDPVSILLGKAQADMLDGLNAVHNTLATIVNQISNFDERLSKIEAVLPKSVALEELKPKPVADEEYKRHINHATAATCLFLQWPPICELTKRYFEKEEVQNFAEYPISVEHNRGALLVHGRGEDSCVPRGIEEHAEYVNPDMAGVDLDFSESKMWAYVESFKRNILNTHPIIQPAMLNDWVRYFLDTLPSSRNHSTEPQNSKPEFAPVDASQTPRSKRPTGLKRKRSQGSDGSEPPTPELTRSGHPDRSIHSALVLTVLALGKVCLHWSNIPQASHVNPNEGILPSPGSGSPLEPSTPSHSLGLPSPREGLGGINYRRSSIHGFGNPPSRSKPSKNYHLIPGLEYFAFATDILGSLTGGYNNIKIVYALLFAGLYHGQLGRPMENFAFNQGASHKLQVIMRPSLNQLRRIKRSGQAIQDTRYNQLALTFWTCLQLESDLIAELQLPPSGLHAYEDEMPQPNMSLLEGHDQRILESYLGHLYLRTHLNRIRRALYIPEDANIGTAKDLFRNVDLVASAVSGIHLAIPSFAFKEDDPPAEDLLSAIFRAKYWGAQVVAYRPVIRQVLQFSHSSQDHPTSPSFSTASSFRQDVIAPAVDANARSQNEIEVEMVELAKRGVKALIESTRALHHIDDKQATITNVFSTAHGQWGNMLVLSAAFRDPVLHHYIDRDLLRTLFTKTIAFLRQSATATSSLRIDMHVLKGIENDLFNSAGKPTL